MRRKYFFVLATIVILGSCTQTKEDKEENKQEVVVPIKKPSEVDLMNEVSLKALVALNNKDYTTFASLFHPKDGVRFSSYGHVNTTDKQLLSKDFLEKINQKTKLNWGVYDGSGEPMIMDIESYLEGYASNKDFINIAQKSLNKTLTSGNSIDNIKESYPNLQYIEYYNKGSIENDGMNWSALTFVFKKYNDAYFIVGFIENQWTT